MQEHGGVGYYPTSGIPFVHVDTGNVRMWPRIPRLELAALFPDGNTKYLPIDGKPITVDRLQARLSRLVTRPWSLPRPVAGSAGAADDVFAEAEIDAQNEVDTPPKRCSLDTPTVIADDPHEPGPPQASSPMRARRHVVAWIRPRDGKPNQRRCPAIRTPKSWARPKPTTTIPTS